MDIVHQLKKRHAAYSTSTKPAGTSKLITVGLPLGVSAAGKGANEIKQHLTHIRLGDRLVCVSLLSLGINNDLAN